jgi:hypothetical protein
VCVCLCPVIVYDLETLNDATKLDLGCRPQKIKSTNILNIFVTVQFALSWRHGDEQRSGSTSF